MSTHDDLPQDLRELAARLGEMGSRDRAHGARVADRVAMRTAHLLRGPKPEPRSLADALRRAWLWLAVPATAAAAILVALAMFRPTLPGVTPAGAEVLAANLERDIDTLLEIDELWRSDAFDDTLALLSLDATQIATRPGEAEPMPTLDTDL